MFAYAPEICYQPVRSAQGRAYTKNRTVIPVLQCGLEKPAFGSLPGGIPTPPKRGVETSLQAA